MKAVKLFMLLSALAAAGGAAAGTPAGMQSAPREANQAAAEAPDVLVRRITQEVMDTARTDKAIKAGDRKRILAVVESRILPHVDLERTVSMAVGRHWREASPDQRAQLTDAFRTMLIRTYAGALSLVGDQKLVYKPLRASPSDDEAVVRFEVAQPRGRDPVQVSYRLHLSPQGWKVYDVNVLGVWLVETYRSSFNAEIERGGIDGLIRALSEKNRSLPASG